MVQAQLRLGPAGEARALESIVDEALHEVQRCRVHVGQLRLARVAQRFGFDSQTKGPVSRSTCPPLSPSPHANSFVTCPAVINNCLNDLGIPQVSGYPLPAIGPALRLVYTVQAHHTSHILYTRHITLFTPSTLRGLNWNLLHEWEVIGNYFVNGR